MQKPLLLILLLFLLNSVNAYDNVYRFNHLSIEEGLPQSSVLSVFQDSKGFIWIGTMDGLCRFDGKKLEVFSARENDNNTINFGTITDIEEGFDGNMYFTTSGGGLNIFNPITEKFKYLDSDSTGNTIISSTINDIHQAVDSTLWIATYDGISHYFPDSNKIVSYNFGENGYPNSTAICIYEDSDSNVWIGTYGDGMCKYIKEEDKFLNFPNQLQPKDDYSINVINKIEHFTNDTVLLLTEDGILKFNLVDKSYSKFAQNILDPSFILVDNSTNIWIATEGSGIYKINKNGIIDNITHNPKNKYSLPTNQLDYIYQDNEENIWLGLSNKGLAYFNPNKNQFSSFSKTDKANSLLGNNIFGLAEDNNNNIWIGTLSGLSIYNPETHIFNNLVSNNTNKSITSNRILSVFHDSDNYMWIGSGDGIDMYDFKSKTFQHFQRKHNDTTTIPDNTILCINEDKNGDIWVGTYLGLGRYSKKTKSWTSYSNTQNKLSDKIIWNMFSDKKGQFWIGTNKGLYKYNFEADSFEVIPIAADGDSYLARAEINSVIQDKEGVYWIGTQQGLVKYSASINEVKRFGIDEGLPNQVIYEIIEYENYIWFSSNKGLTKMNKTTYTVENFDVRDGLQSNEFNLCSVKLHNGIFIFGGINGITTFNPKNIIASTNVPKLYFTKLSLNGKQVYPNDINFGIVPLKESIIEAKDIELSYKEKIISIDFSILNYLIPDKILYRYRIQPTSKEWINLNTKNTLTLSNLPPGKYKLEIQSTNSEQLWLDNTEFLRIYIHPPFYNQKWFYALEMFLVIFLVLWYVRRRTKRVNSINLKLEETVVERTEEIQSQKEELEVQRDRISEQKTKIEKFAENLEQQILDRTEELKIAKEKAEESDRLKSAFLANMSHEIRTPMNAIIGFSELLSSLDLSNEEKTYYASIIRSNSESLLNLLNDILDISIIESGKIGFSKREITIDTLIQSVYDSFLENPLLKEKPQVVFSLVNCKPKKHFIKTDEFRLIQILNNLISNAIKYTNDGEIELSAYIDGDNIIFKVRDTGIGILPRNIEKIFDRFRKIDDNDTNPYRGGGLGLAISRNLVTLMGGKIWVDSIPKIGSSFYFELPGIYEKVDEI